MRSINIKRQKVAVLFTFVWVFLANVGHGEKAVGTLHTRDNDASILQPSSAASSSISSHSRRQKGPVKRSETTDKTRSTPEEGTSPVGVAPKLLQPHNNPGQPNMAAPSDHVPGTSGTSGQ